MLRIVWNRGQSCTISHGPEPTHSFSEISATNCHATLGHDARKTEGHSGVISVRFFHLPELLVELGRKESRQHTQA